MKIHTAVRQRFASAISLSASSLDIYSLLCYFFEVLKLQLIIHQSVVIKESMSINLIILKQVNKEEIVTYLSKDLRETSNSQKCADLIRIKAKITYLATKKIFKITSYNSMKIIIGVQRSSEFPYHHNINISNLLHQCH
ncbi:CLUMA_CG015472, isoform A [Clunio marinus]|uniref:CLUMA_CG015472, isoform A n=1 Tax=Clunio marinus TaxID=568069 RepID=A0A1J1IRK6_9DIPT|nr:CLUMA_CG015472, isoform A [Clunio marinus]